MTKDQIIAALPSLTPEELGEVQHKLDELTDTGEWVDDGELTDEEKAAVEEGLAQYLANPDDVMDVDEAFAQIRANLRNR